MTAGTLLFIGGIAAAAAAVIATIAVILGNRKRKRKAVGKRSGEAKLYKRFCFLFDFFAAVQRIDVCILFFKITVDAAAYFPILLKRCFIGLQVLLCPFCTKPAD